MCCPHARVGCDSRHEYVGKKTWKSDGVLWVFVVVHFNVFLISIFK